MEEEDKREDHQLLGVKTHSEATIKIIKVDTRNLNSNQDHLSLLLLSLSIQKKQNPKKSKSSLTNSK